jgi:cytochrome P450
MGHRLEADTKVQLFPGSANRDPAKWPDPDSFDSSRKLGMHLAFGAGIHNCIGRMIAQLEVESLLGAMLDRFERIELIGDTRLRPFNALRTLETLPLKLIRR